MLGEKKGNKKLNQLFMTIQYFPIRVIALGFSSVNKDTGG